MICTTCSLVGVANPISICIVGNDVAFHTCLTDAVYERAGVVLVRCILVVVARQLISTPWHFICIANAIAVGVVGQNHARFAGFTGLRNVRARTIFLRGRTVEVASRGIGASKNFVGVTHPIRIRIFGTIARAHAKCVQLVSVTITGTGRNVRTSALIDLSRAIADSARVECTDAIVHIVTDAIGIKIFRAIATAHAQSVKLISVAVAIACRDAGTPTFIHFSWAIADATSIEFAHAGIHIITDAIGIGILQTIASAYTQCILLVAIAITIPFWNAGTSTGKDRSRTVAHATSIKRSHAVVQIVTNAIGIGVSLTVATAHAERIELIAVAVAVTLRNVKTSALEDVAWTVANATRV